MDQYIGKMLDNRYEILDVIGVGGMAVVYKAYCHRLHRFVAIKVLKRDLATDAEFRRRFHEEAQAVAMLSHPNIVSVYDVSRGDDLDYIVMELIDGITLKQYMQKKDGSLNWRESLYFITQIVRALGHAHGRGIIHRDIKPQNIMVLRDGSVKVADFGIARIMSVAQNTLTQEALGSVHYISPEQARGSHIDARADLYSVGVVLYEMLTGRLPFDGDSPVSVAIQHINSTPLPPRQMNPEIPVGLEEITMKAMAARIDRRYMNAEAMLRDLEEFRKNPQVKFHYNLAQFHGNQPVPDDPTQILDTTGSMGRRQRPPSRPRPTPPPQRRSPTEPPREYEEPRNTKRTVVIPIVVVLFLVGVGLFLWVAFFSGMFERNDTQLEVPNLVGKNLAEVLTDTELQKQFKVERKSIEYDDKYAEGQIISQDPQGGTKVEQGSTIHVVVSGGQEPIEMVDVENMRYEDAVSKLKSMNLNVDTPEKKASDQIEEGRVISSNPAKGVQLKPGDTIHLVVSTGPESKSVVVPPVVGQSLDSARAMLSAVNLTIANIVEVESDEAKGLVTYQSIAAGTEVDEGSSITLNVSKGKPETTERTGSTQVQLPTDKESVSVRVTVNGVEQYNTTVNTETGTVWVSINGSGTQEVSVYFDGELTDTYQFSFDENKRV